MPASASLGRRPLIERQVVFGIPHFPDGDETVLANSFA